MPPDPLRSSRVWVPAAVDVRMIYDVPARPGMPVTVWSNEPEDTWLGHTGSSRGNVALNTVSATAKMLAKLKLGVARRGSVGVNWTESMAVASTQ